MKCLSLEQVYLYLEKELSPGENTRIEEHLSTCRKCRDALEERKPLLQAADSLPLWEAPPGFTQQIMARIFPPRVPISAWLTAAYIGSGSIIIAILSLFLVTGQNFSGFLTSLNHSLLSFVRSISPFFVKVFKVASIFVKVLQQLLSISPFFVKVFKVASIFVKVLQQLFGYIIKAFASLTAIISPQVQLIIITIVIILIVFSIYGIKRKILIGEEL
jgi:predicted anti-sigma-YlaC factor YlaD